MFLNVSRFHTRIISNWNVQAIVWTLEHWALRQSALCIMSAAWGINFLCIFNTMSKSCSKWKVHLIFFHLETYCIHSVFFGYIHIVVFLKWLRKVNFSTFWITCTFYAQIVYTISTTCLRYLKYHNLSKYNSLYIAFSKISWKLHFRGRY